MASTFNINKPGKHFYDLSAVAGEVAGIQGDVLCCINQGEGPTVLLCAGIHGDEYEPQTVLRHLAETLETEQVIGRLIIIPAINYAAAQSGARVSPADGQNMNRVFPGKADGTPTERLAAFITREIFPATDLLIDAHTGGNDVNVVPMILDLARMSASSAILNSPNHGSLGLSLHSACDGHRLHNLRRGACGRHRLGGNRRGRRLSQVGRAFDDPRRIVTRIGGLGRAATAG